MGILYIVATPIGNLGDMSSRAIEVLRQVRVIAAEDTRRSATLLRTYEIDTPLVSYHKHNERSRVEALLGDLAQGDVALISDAGTPGISDPGYILVAEAIRHGHRVTPIPGASSLLAAICASGIVPGEFLFAGFLPRGGDERSYAIGRAVAARVPFVVFEAPGRTAATLRDLSATIGERQCVVARELTKIHEEFRRGTVSEMASLTESDPPRGEVVIVIGGAEDEGAPRETDPSAMARLLLDRGMKPSKAARALAEIAGISGSEAYGIVRSLSAEKAASDG